MEKTGAKQFLYRMLCGFLLGISVVGPGISGGVMAVLLGIYDRLIAIAAHPFRKLRETAVYLLPMGVGAAVSFALFVVVLKFLFEHYTTPTYLLFIALILGGIPAIYRKAASEPVRGTGLAICVLAFLAAAALGLVGRSDFTFTLHTESVPYLAICGLIAGAVSVVPGLSVSIVLMLLGVYETLLAKTAAFDVLTMAPVAVCFLIGLVLFSRVIKRVFDGHGTLGYFAVLGFMSGSIVGLLPDLPVGAAEWTLSAVLFAGGLALSAAFARLARVLHVEARGEPAS